MCTYLSKYEKILWSKKPLWSWTTLSKKTGNLSVFWELLSNINVIWLTAITATKNLVYVTIKSFFLIDLSVSLMYWYFHCVCFQVLSFWIPSLVTWVINKGFVLCAPFYYPTTETQYIPIVSWMFNLLDIYNNWWY